MKFLDEKADLINDRGLDEMQKTYAYKLAFKCFKALYWITFIISLIMILIATSIEESVIFAISALVLELSSSIVYIVFGAKASKLGAMNPVFAKYMSNPTTIIGYFILAGINGVWYALNFTNEGSIYYIFAGLFLLIIIGTFITLGFISKKNNKVLDEEENE